MMSMLTLKKERDEATLISSAIDGKLSQALTKAE